MDPILNVMQQNVPAFDGPEPAWDVTDHPAYGSIPLGLSRVKPGANAFTGFPAQYEGATPAALMHSALNEPLSLFSTLEESAKSGVLDSFYLGSLIRKVTTDPGAPQWANRGESPESYQARRAAANPLTEDQYKASASYRADIPWDKGMTDTRAAALADSYDAQKVREYFTQKRPITAFIGNMGGQALDPINYIPIVGEAVKSAQIARFGYVGGRLITGAADAALNTGIASVATQGERAKFGDDVSWQSTVSTMAMAALIGGAFGAVHGVFEGRAPRVDPQIRARAEENLSTLKNVQESRIALNEGIDAVVRGEDVNLSPNATEPLARIAQDVQRIEATRRATVDAAPVTKAATMEDVSASYKAVAVAHPELDQAASPSSFDSLMIADLQAKGFDGIAGDAKARPMPLSFDPATIDVPVVTKAPVFGGLDPNLNPSIPEFAAAVSAKVSEASIASLTRRYEIGNRMHNRLLRWLDPKTGLGFGRFDNHEMLPQLISYHQRELQTAARPIDTSRPALDSLPEGHKEAQARIGKPDDPKATADQYRVDLNTGAFPEEADLHQLAVEGRMTPEDVAAMTEAHTQFDQAHAYGEALKSLATCLI
ncbi:hypothetical protein FJ434_16465 [Mesorhizobium sp. B2-5-13]|uniref:hypothetical protein n=1 Tax=unclassified Mesorhizobium TaxID=325217 RepID=UPI0011290C59|nr:MULTISPECIES: hypothetical protein [unclassified Mesorhizobium]TPJ85518.1 hypothetical protein FJ434_16465 [Mesorhizobium sp. B2-5-13]TPK39270.1 hypothetical protein FJ560_29395 [Mesorhizobium sp. B2-5-5]